MYPYGFEFQSVSLNTYVGILVEMGRFNGTRELMSRASGAAELLRLYQEVHYPAHAPVGTFTELDYSEYLGDNTAYRAMPYLSFLLITAVDYGRFQREEVSVLAREYPFPLCSRCLRGLPLRRFADGQGASRSACLCRLCIQSDARQPGHAISA